ncbi:hypothetical protein GCM10023235_64560 [Kitasatospora terrestris]|uniref:Beta-xylosidase C-terminal Concanavalin A-like domain-containing protein n=1 Tax=Kitasatospora terrestris TaxID=258051 RepID=A0ABP9EDB3_9ACTN
MRGGRSPQSLVGPSLVARRMTAPRCSFTAEVEFRPRSFQQSAGVTAYYTTLNWYFLHVTAGDAGRRVLRLVSSDRGVVRFEEAADAVLAEGAAPRLGVDVDCGELRFRHRADAAWRPFGPVLGATVLSDEHAEHVEHGVIRETGSTGASVGPWVRDLTGGSGSVSHLFPE